MHVGLLAGQYINKKMGYLSCDTQKVIKNFKNMQ